MNVDDLTLYKIYDVLINGAEPHKKYWLLDAKFCENAADDEEIYKNEIALYSQAQFDKKELITAMQNCLENKKDGFLKKRKVFLKKELDGMTTEIDLSYVSSRVLGCNGHCPSCSARCERTFMCESAEFKTKHHSKYHRPMGYKTQDSEERKGDEKI